MRIVHYYKEDDLLKINLVAETQQEASELIELCNSFKSPIRAYGRVSKDNTWAWIFIPLKRVPYNINYFGNDKP